MTSRTTWPHADVAILKVNATNLPVVPLGDDTIVNTGDTVEALGYPCVASFGSGTAEHSTVTATFSSGQVTNRLQTPAGSPRSRTARRSITAAAAARCSTHTAR